MLSESAEKIHWLVFWELVNEQARLLDLLDADKLHQSDESADAACEEPK